MNIIMCGMNDERRFQLARSQLNVELSLIRHEFLVHSGNDCRINEHFIRVCVILLYVGEKCGFFVVEEDGVLSSMSCLEFVELFVPCLAMMHMLCVRDRSKYGVPKEPIWIMDGADLKVMEMNRDVPLRRVERAVYPHVRQSGLQPMGLGSNWQLMEKFVELSSMALRVAEERWRGGGKRGWSDGRVRNLEVCMRGKGEAVQVRLVAVDVLDYESECRVVKSRQWRRYWSIGACSGSETVYDDRDLVESRCFHCK